jgi:CheY-like chemotaxis protein
MAKKTILIVDDESSYQEIMKIILSNYINDIEIITASNGKEAKNIITENNKIDLIITDLQMPIMNGTKLIDWLKFESNLNIPIILMSSMLEPQHNANYFIRKGTNIEEIIKIVKKLLS